MPKIPKARHWEHEVYCIPTVIMNMRTSPYEPWAAPPPVVVFTGNAANYPTLVDENDYIDSLYNSPFLSYRATNPGYPSRIDMRLISLSMQGTGGEAVFEVKSNKYLQKAFPAGRGIAVWVSEFIDNQTGLTPAGKTCLASQQIGLFFVSPDGGVTSRRGPDGQNILTIKAVTPDVFLSRATIQKLPYLLKSIVDKERAAWSSRPRTDTALGFTPDGSGPFTADPFAGFANFIDIYTSPPDAILTPRPANEAHFLNSLGAQYALYEMLSHHVMSNSGAGWRTVLEDFIVSMDFTNAETQVVSTDVGPGSVQDAIMESCRHGMYRYWWDSKSHMWYQPDYCTMDYGSIPTSMVVRNGASMVGELQVTLGPTMRRVNRAVVEGLWSANTAGAGDGPQNYFSTGLGAAVYPHGQGLGGIGDDVLMQGYIGQNVGFMSNALFAKSNQRTTFQLTNFPFISMAAALFNRVVGIDMADPLQGYDFRSGIGSLIGVDVGHLNPDGTYYGTNGKLFAVDMVSIECQDPESPQNHYLATISGTEIIPKITG